MKAIKYFGMLLAAFTLSFTATSCGDLIEDDDSGIEIKKSDPKFTKKTATELEVYSSNGFFAEVWYAKFNSNKELVQITMSFTYLEEETAKEAAQSYKHVYDPKLVSIKGKTVTIDATPEFKDDTYDDILAYFNYLVTGIEE